MSYCMFCKIITNEITCKKVYENKNILAFYDLNPVADVHILIIPKKHIASLNDLCISDEYIMGILVSNIHKVAKKVGINSFKTIFNTGKEVGQTIFHIHAHILSGNIHSIP